MQLKILSWNIWINGKFDQVVDFLKTSNADIIGLQEVVPDDPKRNIVSSLEKLSYYHIFAPVEHTWRGKVYNDGPAIFSKYKIFETETYILSKNNPRAAIRADIQFEDKALHIFSTHLIHTHQKHLDEQDEQVINLLKHIPNKNAILMGDFNATPQSKVIKKVKKVLNDSDPLSQPTWSIYPAGCMVCNPQSVDTRLDYIFTTKDLKTSSFDVENSRASDHLPISVLVEV